MVAGGFSPFYVHKHHNKRGPSPSCKTGGFYLSPKAGQVISTSNPVNITWDTSCLSGTTDVDIYLYAPGANQSRIHVWQQVPYSPGSYQTEFKPKWWNAETNIKLQLAIVNTGSPPFLATLPAGPVFNATYTPPSSGGVPAVADLSHPDSPVTAVGNAPHKGPTKGGIAAAVIFPLLILAGIAFAMYVRISRTKVAKDRKRFSRAVDARMSTIATEWRAISTAGAEAAVRHSMAVTANRVSMAINGGRPPTIFATDADEEEAPATSSNQIRRPGVGPRTPLGVHSNASSERVSRISFAADTVFARPSVDAARGKTSLDVRRAGAATRSFHMSNIPPVPELKTSDYDNEKQGKNSDKRDSDDDMERALSPTQRDGPLSLSAEDIRARLSGHDNARPSLDEVLPALSMMRNSANGDLLITPKSQSPPPVPPMPQLPLMAVNSIPKSPIMDTMPMQAMSEGMSSPDAMLRAYAERRATGSTGGLTYPAPTAGNGGMRILYGNNTGTATMPGAVPRMSGITYPTVGSNNPYRSSMAVTLERTSGEELDDRNEHEGEDSAYGYAQ